MTEVFVGAGSNIEPERHLRQALAALAARYGVLRLSPVYRNPAVGFDGPDFLNMVVGFDTDDDLDTVLGVLDEIESAAGRVRGEPRYASRALDLDLLLYGDLVTEGAGVTLPRPDITVRAFVLKPLADIAGHRRHPVEGVSFARMWRDFVGEPRRLEAVNLPLEA